MAAQVISCGPYPECNMTLMLFSNVLNAAEVRKCVMGGEFEAALLKTSMVLHSDFTNIMIFLCFSALNHCNFLQVLIIL